MTDAPAHMTTPCENCPYRRDALRRLWHRSEFEGLLDAETAPLGRTYACHKQASLSAAERGFCAGWLLDQKRRGLPSIALRLVLLRDPTAVVALDAVNDGGHPMFRTIRAMCRANGVRR
jgi:hypothetical protein